MEEENRNNQQEMQQGAKGVTWLLSIIITALVERVFEYFNIQRIFGSLIWLLMGCLILFVVKKVKSNSNKKQFKNVISIFALASIMVFLFIGIYENWKANLPPGDNTPSSATESPVPTVSQNPSLTPTVPPTPTVADTPTPTPTNTPTPTATNTPTPTATNTPTPTATNTPVPTATNTPTPTATNTPVPTPTSTPTPVPTNTPTPTPTWTPWTKDDSLADDPNYNVRTKVVIKYGYREKITESSSSPTMQGWIYDYATSVDQLQEDWTTTVLTAENSDEWIKTEMREETTKITQYRGISVCYFSSDGTHIYREKVWTAKHGTYTLNKKIESAKQDYSGCTAANKKYNIIYSPWYDAPPEFVTTSAGVKKNFPNGGSYWGYETQEVDKVCGVTYYQKYKKIYTYYFYQWSDEAKGWREDVPYEETSTRKPESKSVVYYSYQPK